MKIIKIIIVSLLLVGCSKVSENDITATYVSKCVAKEKNDGWFEIFCIEPLKKDQNLKEVKNNYFYNDKTTYSFDGYNLKYKEIKDCYIPIYDKKGNEVGKVPTSVPSFATSKIYRDEIKEISSFFNTQKFKTKITLNDLEELKIKKIDKQELVNLFNEAFEKEPIEVGKFKNIPILNIIQSESSDDYIFQVGYYCEYGVIQKINIEVIFNNNTYLSDLVQKKNPKKEYINMQEDIETFEKYILENQDLDISKSNAYKKEYKKLSGLLISINDENKESKKEF